MKVAWETFKKILGKITSSQYFWYGVFIGLAYYAYTRLTKPKEDYFLEKAIPNNGTDIPSNWSPDSLAEQFNDYFTSWFTAAETYITLLTKSQALTDGQFFMLVQTYNAKFGKVDKKSFYTRVKNSILLVFVGENPKQPVLDRMIRLKLNY